MNGHPPYVRVPAMWYPVLVVGILCCLPRTTAADTHALVVGHNQGQSTEAALRYAESDARGVGKALVEVGAVARNNIEMLVGIDLNDIRATFAAQSRSVGRNDSLIVFLSAHGDHRGLHIGGDLWTWSELRGAIDSIKAGVVVVFVDACQSGALLTPKGFVKVPRMKVKSSIWGPRGRVMITSSGPSELSHESTLLKSSPFAHYLVSGLRGAADGNSDGQITVGEIYGYIYTRALAATLNATAGAQRAAQDWSLRGTGEVVLARTGSGRARVHLGGADLGRCYFLDHQGQRVLAEIGPETPKMLPLAPAKYLVKCLQDDQLRVARITLTNKDVALDQIKFEVEERTSSIAKGEKQIWRHRLELGGGVLDQVRETPWPALTLGFHSGPENGGMQLLAIGALNVSDGDAPSSGCVVALAGTDVRLPWWHLLGSTMSVGIEAGVDARIAVDRDTRLAATVGPYARLGWLAARRVPIALRLDLLSGVPLDGSGKLALAVLASVTSGIQFGGTR